MTVEKLAALLGAQALSRGEAGLSVTGCMVCDVMSRAIAGGFRGMAWITCMGSVNALAVSVMTGASCLILADGLAPDEKTLERAQNEKIWVLSARESAFTLAGRLYEAGLRQGNGAKTYERA